MRLCEVEAEAGARTGTGSSQARSQSPSPRFTPSSYACLHGPSLAEFGLHVRRSLGRVGDAAGGGVELEGLAAQADGDVAQEHALGEPAGVVEVREGDR